MLSDRGGWQRVQASSVWQNSCNASGVSDLQKGDGVCLHDRRSANLRCKQRLVR